MASTFDVTALKLLADDLERLKEAKTAAEQRGDAAQREEIRNRVMMRLATDQLTKWKTDAAEITAATDREKQRNDLLETDMAVQKAQNARLGDELKVAKMKLADAASREAAGGAASKSEAERSRGLADRLRGELEAARTAVVVEAEAHSFELRRLKQTVAALEVQVRAKREALEVAEESRQRDAKSTVEAQYRLGRDLDKTKKQLVAVQDELNDLKKSAFESVVEARAQTTQLTDELHRCKAASQINEADLRDRLERAILEQSRQSDRVDTEMQTRASRERVLEKETAKLTADLRSAQAEINAMVDLKCEAEKARTADVVRLSAERDALQRQVGQLESQAEDLRSSHGQKEVHLRTDLTQAGAALAEAARARGESAAAAVREAATLKAAAARSERELEAARRQIATLEARLDALVDEKAHAEAQLNARLAAEKTAVDRLEKQIEENAEVNRLSDDVASLTDQRNRLAQQLTHTNSVLAALRVEADISEGARVQLVQDEAAALQRRVVAMERERRFARPLIRDLVAALQATDAPTDVGLERDVDVFHSQFGNTALN